ncbi:hypothetical protein Tco_0600606 [Tanacetum coccineum]
MVALEDFLIPFPIPLNSIMPTVIRPPVIINNIPFDQYTTNLFSSGSSKYSPSPPPKMEEIKRLAALKLKKEKTKKRLKKVMTPNEIKAQVEELAAYEAKKVKSLKEYNHCITFRDDPLPITKISYRVNNYTKEATIRITRNNQALNLKIYDKFVLKILGFSEWLEVFDIAFKNQTKSNDQLLRNLKSKFQWIATQAGKLGIPPPPEIRAFKLPSTEKKKNLKRKRRAKLSKRYCQRRHSSKWDS